MSVQADSTENRPAQTRAPHELIAAFLDSASEVPDDSDLDGQLVVTNGAQTWDPGDLETVNFAAGTDPTWLQIRAAMNNAVAQEK